MKIDISQIENEKSLIAIYLFGSVAEGKQSSLSDIDICIMGKFSEKQKLRILSNMPEKYDVSFFDELPIWIKIRVFKGKPLFIKDKEELYKINFKTLEEYEDFRPLIQRRILRRFGEYARP